MDITDSHSETPGAARKTSQRQSRKTEGSSSARAASKPAAPPDGKRRAALLAADALFDPAFASAADERKVVTLASLTKMVSISRGL